MPTNNTEGRYIEHIAQDLDLMPTFFTSLRPFRNGKDQDVLLPLPIHEGQRDDTIFRQAGRLREWNIKYSLNLAHDDMVETMQEINRFLCAPPLEERIVEGKMESALFYPTSAKSTEETRGLPGCPYFMDGQGYLCRWKEKGERQISIRLANFNARIIEEVYVDNGLEQTRRFVIEGETSERRLPRVTVTASSFPSMNWVYGAWGELGYP